LDFGDGFVREFQQSGVGICKVFDFVAGDFWEKGVITALKEWF
jgi:hypothetical protein